MSNRWKTGLTIACCCILALTVLAAGCGPSKTPDAAGDEKPRIALIMKSLANEFFKTMEDGAKAHQKEHADQYDLVVNGMKDERDLDQQVKLVEQMIAERVDAIVIAPADSKALVPVCKRAMEAGIVVVNIDNQFDGKVLEAEKIKIPFVGPDNRRGARKVGDCLAAHLKSGDQVAILEGMPSAFNAQQRRLGFEDAMKAAGMDVVDVQSGQWEMQKANVVAAAMINNHVDLKAILCSNDSMALGAEAAVKAANKRGEIIIVGFDNISAIQQMLEDGRVLATADQHADQLAVYGVEFALKIHGGKATPADKETSVDLITADTLR